MALVDAAVVEKHDAIRATVPGVQIRAGVNFTVGEVFAARAGEPTHSCGINFEIGSGRGLEMEFTSRHELFGKFVEGFAQEIRAAVHDGMPARFENFAVNRFKQWFGG